MNRALGWLCAAALTAAFGAPAVAQTTENTDGTTEVTDQFSLTEETPLAFGTIVRPGSGSNLVTVSAAGARTLSGGGNATLVGSSFSAATYTVAGDGGQAFDIEVPPSFLLTRSGGSETIEVTLLPSAASGMLSGTTGNVGEAEFSVGGNFTVTTGTVIGLYSGTFTVTVENN